MSPTSNCCAALGLESDDESIIVKCGRHCFVSHCVERGKEVKERSAKFSQRLCPNG